MSANAYEVIWPDGGTYANRDGATRLDADEASATARAIGGRWRRASEPGELPLASLGETFLASAVCWAATAPDGTPWDLRWFRDGLILIAAAGVPLQVGFRAKAPTIQQARLHAVRIANLIADGITRED